MTRPSQWRVTAPSATPGSWEGVLGGAALARQPGARFPFWLRKKSKRFILSRIKFAEDDAVGGDDLITANRPFCEIFILASLCSLALTLAPGAGFAADGHQGHVDESHILIAGQAVQSQSTLSPALQSPALKKPAARLKVVPPTQTLPPKPPRANPGISKDKMLYLPTSHTKHKPGQEAPILGRVPKTVTPGPTMPGVKGPEVEADSRILFVPLKTQTERDAAKSLHDQRLEHLQKLKDETAKDQEEEREGAWVGGAAGCAAAAALGASAGCGDKNQHPLEEALSEKKQANEPQQGLEGGPGLEISEEDRERIDEEKRLEEAKESAEEARENFKDLLENLKKSAEHKSEENKKVTNP